MVRRYLRCLNNCGIFNITIIGYASDYDLTCSDYDIYSDEFIFGSGGGASDVRIGGTALSNRVLVAGGGGGGGTGDILYPAYGGDGGYDGGKT